MRSELSLYTGYSYQVIWTAAVGLALVDCLVSQNVGKDLISRATIFFPRRFCSKNVRLVID